MNNKFLSFLGICKKAGKLLEGYNKCEDAIIRKKLSLLILSSDISENTKNKFIKYCDTYNVPYIESDSKFELGAVLGREEINILGVTDSRMSSQLRSLWVQNQNN